jgi:hypothetical protein
MKKYVFTILVSALLMTFTVTGRAQSAQSYFNTSANHYVNGRFQEAVQRVTEGLKKYPGDAKLKALLEKLKKDEQDKKDKKEQEKKEQQKKDQEKKEQEKKDQEQKDKDKKDQEKKDQEQKDKEKKDQEKKDQEQKDQEKKDQEKKEQEEKEKKEQQEKEQQDEEKKSEKKNVPPEVAKKLQEMKISEDKARLILDAMKNQEVQYLQQNKRKPTKPRDKGKPDW